MTSTGRLGIATAPLARRPAPDRRSAAALRWARLALVVAVWTSAAIFGLYIVAFYAGAVSDGSLERWNKSLPHLYEPGTALATTGIALHFVAGAVLLALGPLQLIRTVREKSPALHRWIGCVYVLSALVAGLGGLSFIALKGTVGGAVMDVGFGLYGGLMVLAAIETVRHARQQRFDEHRAWAIRLFALTIGSWLYRMDYGFWWLMTHGAGHTRSFDGPFDIAMAFFFYIPNLIVAEVFIRARHRCGPRTQMIAALSLGGAAAFLTLSTYYLTKFQWGPPILARLFGSLV
jgi:uncharacterized membrane protein